MASSVIKSRSSDDEYRWALHNLDVARQLAKCLPLTPPASADMSAWVPPIKCRDSAMAENVRWALENEGRQGRLLVFAHNAHVMNWKSDGRRWANVLEKPSMMGSHLRRVYGKDLYIIAMSCATTSGGFRTATPMKEDSTWLTTRRSLNANVDAQSLITPSTAMDAFFFVNTLTPEILSRATPTPLDSLTA
jgi:erythromycin esterase